MNVPALMRFCANASSIWMSSFDAMLFANLLLEYFPIEPALPDQFLVCPAFDDATVLEHQDLVRVMNGQEALRDYKRRAPLAQTPHRRLNQMLRRRVHARCRIIQDQNARVHQEGPRDSNALPLASAQRH